MRCVAPDSANNFPIMAPDMMTMMREPNVSPTPFCMADAILAAGIPNKNAAVVATNMNAMNGLNFSQEINKIRNKIDMEMTNNNMLYQECE